MLLNWCGFIFVFILLFWSLRVSIVRLSHGRKCLWHGIGFVPVKEKSWLIYIYIYIYAFVALQSVPPCLFLSVCVWESIHFQKMYIYIYYVCTYALLENVIEVHFMCIFFILLQPHKTEFHLRFVITQKKVYFIAAIESKNCSTFIFPCDSCLT